MLRAGKHSDAGTISLTPEVIRLSEVVVTPGSYSIMDEGPVRAQILGSEELENMSFAEDITRAVTRLPGVASYDYSSRFTIRGGESDETLMTLDGMELYEPFHQRDFVGGLFSIVDIETIQEISPTVVTGIPTRTSTLTRWSSFSRMIAATVSTASSRIGSGIFRVGSR